MQNFRNLGALLGAGAVIFSLAGCADRNGNGQPDSAATGAEVGNTAAAVTNSVADAGKDVANVASDAGKSISNVAAGAANTASEAGKSAADAVTAVGAAATITPKIKTELGKYDANTLKGSMIDVDTNGTTKTVTLKGTAKTQQQKAFAGAIAKKFSSGFTVANQLTVK